MKKYYNKMSNLNRFSALRQYVVFVIIVFSIVAVIRAERTLVILGNGWDGYPYTSELWQMVIENSLDSAHHMEYTHYDRGAFDAAKLVREMAFYGRKGYDRVITVSMRESDVVKDKKTSIPFVAEKGDLSARYVLHMTVYTTHDENMESKEYAFAYSVLSYGSLGSKKVTQRIKLQMHKKAVPLLSKDIVLVLK